MAWLLHTLFCRRGPYFVEGTTTDDMTHWGRLLWCVTGETLQSPPSKKYLTKYSKMSYTVQCESCGRKWRA